MKVFISWSGELSKLLAEALRKWLPRTLQTVKPYFTPDDIEKGSKWDAEISKELEATDICIIALTRDSLKSQWIAFEAGAISRTVEKARVCPIVFDIEPTDIQGPLARFQAAKFSKGEIRKLLGTINAATVASTLREADLDAVFEKWWPDLESEVNSIQKLARRSSRREPVRTERELIEEILEIVRTIVTQQHASHDTSRASLQEAALDYLATAADEKARSNLTNWFLRPRRLRERPRDRDEIDVSLEIDPKLNAAIFQEITALARRFGEMHSVVEGTESIYFTLGAQLGRGLTQHLQTLKADLGRIKGVTNVELS
jgi:TIR domain